MKVVPGGKQDDMLADYLPGLVSIPFLKNFLGVPLRPLCKFKASVQYQGFPLTFNQFQDIGLSEIKEGLTGNELFDWESNGKACLRLFFIDPPFVMFNELVNGSLRDPERRADDQRAIVLYDQGESSAFASNDLIDLYRHYFSCSVIHGG